jgi:5-methyltetrahydrofolate--homocysteine methyltransferase
MLGVSNVSHGLPSRPLLNAAFLDAAAAAGLDAGIINPNDHVIMGAVELANQHRGEGVEPRADHDVWGAWDAAYAAALDVAASGTEALSAAEEDAGEADPHVALALAVLRGNSDAAPTLVDAVIASGTPAEQVIEDVLAPAIQRLGDAFGRGEAFLPQLMIAADAMKAAVARVKEHLPEGSAGVHAPKVAFATVKGDIHSIGKDICVSLLESQGFDVVDLGVDVPAERVLEAAMQAQAVCLSALMTTTLPAMRDIVEQVRATAADLPVFVGGAVVTAEWAESIGAGYSADAPGCVQVVREAIAARAGEPA